jgi:hypothetical protein
MAAPLRWRERCFETATRCPATRAGRAEDGDEQRQRHGDAPRAQRPDDLSLSVSPLSTLTCTGNQHVVILSVSFDLTLTGDDLPPVHLTG